MLLLSSFTLATNEEGIKEVKKKKGLEAPLFVYLHCLLEAQLFVYLSKPFFFYFFNLTVISRYTNSMEMYRFIQE